MMGHGSLTRQAPKSQEPEPIAEPETEAQATSSTHPRRTSTDKTNSHASKPTEDSELPGQGTSEADDAETIPHGAEPDERRTATAKELEQLEAPISPR